MDLSKAHDFISHDLFIPKMEAYRFYRNALNLVYSFLTNQIQRVKTGSAYMFAKCCE